MKLVDVYAAMLPGLAFKPTVHVSYGEKVLSIKDLSITHIVSYFP
jgi:hypothetical protein